MPLAIVAPEPALLALCRSGRPRIEAERGNIEVFRDGAIGLFQLAVLVDDEVLHERGVAKLCFELVDRHLQFFGQRVEELGALVFNHRSEEHTSELQSLMRISYAVFCLKKKKSKQHKNKQNTSKQ